MLKYSSKTSHTLTLDVSSAFVHDFNYILNNELHVL